MFFSKRALKVLSSCSRCSDDKFFLLLLAFRGVIAFVSQSPVSDTKSPQSRHTRAHSPWRLSCMREYLTIVAWRTSVVRLNGTPLEGRAVQPKLTRKRASRRNDLASSRIESKSPATVASSPNRASVGRKGASQKQYAAPNHVGPEACVQFNKLTGFARHPGPCHYIGRDMTSSRAGARQSISAHERGGI